MESEQICYDFLVDLNSKHPLDLVYAQYFSFNSLAAAKFSKLTGVPLVISSFGRDLDVGMSSDSRFLDYAHKIIPTAKIIVTPTEAIASRVKMLASDTINSPIIRTVAPPLDQLFLAKHDWKHRLITEGPTLVTINSCFKPDKGIEAILDAVAYLYKNGWKSTRLLIYGTDDHPELENHQRLLKLIHHLGIHKIVQFCGYAGRAEVRSALIKCDLFIDARHTSGFSSVLLEALSCGAAIICSRNDASNALVKDELTALQFDITSSGALGKILSGLLENPDRVKSLRDCARIWFSENSHKYSATQALSNLWGDFKKITKA